MPVWCFHPGLPSPPGQQQRRGAPREQGGHHQILPTAPLSQGPSGVRRHGQFLPQVPTLCCPHPPTPLPGPLRQSPEAHLQVDAGDDDLVQRRQSCPSSGHHVVPSSTSGKDLTDHRCLRRGCGSVLQQLVGQVWQPLAFFTKLQS